MHLKMSCHASRPDSSAHQFKVRAPRAVLDRVRGREIVLELPAVGSEPAAPFRTTLGEFAKGSLHTRNADVADTRRLAVLAHLSRICSAAKAGPVTLSQRQIQGLAGQVHKLLEAEHSDNPGTEAEWITFKALTRAAIEGRIPGAPPIPERGRSDDSVLAELLFGETDDLTGTINSLPMEWGTIALEQRAGRLALWVLGRNGIEVAPETHIALLREIARAALQFAHQAKRMARGDYRPDPDRDRFPEFERSKPAGVTLSGVFDRWKAEVKPTPSTVSTWRGVIRSLTAHLKQDVEIGKLTKADVIAWKDALVERGVRPKTVNDQHLAGLKALLNFAVRNGLVTENVATGVRLQVKAKAGERMLPYSDDDVARLLDHASRETAPAKQWLPMLAVLTGARIGELAQAWGDQVRQIDGVWCLEIRPAEDGGTLKNVGSERTVPLHPALIEAGFVQFAQERGNRPMFYLKPARRGAEAKHPSKGVSNHLGTWIRALPEFDDPRKAPAHAARHWFKTTGGKLEIMDSLVNAIQGHTDGSAAGTYRHFSTEQMAKAVARYPVPGLQKPDDGAAPL
ncbi:hypothetical protein MKL09_14360 [Methylobacterium sp. J-048]|uniref:hypothetical protein n=1 Tax=Methylobacterium sp. J-048 TaxID=2836635 RepID=UPI001FB8CF73|nr:hypothetical protein [Methylobacterium sp. J-048]MCJ2057734.1 hypothetical protein [Methylobacterium sp. J-048]